ncbi:hypothetical protein DUNSADRAFT_3019 [Dunaliella salina]|uniref:Encoded protein n=1 Tax=Dunaliella salina TaxID=3046 RepID=A0ABQ7GUS8_DUNSA|nr:hypothetical protein DUNSADRAFT_3019 [Dunaliella salina]|eukprot:KAF5838348.1 hypothetical protein DUNSADRAFT_3019 [Dunaliella salina]
MKPFPFLHRCKVHRLPSWAGGVQATSTLSSQAHCPQVREHYSQAQTAPCRHGQPCNPSPPHHRWSVVKQTALVG